MTGCGRAAEAARCCLWEKDRRRSVHGMGTNILGSRTIELSEGEVRIWDFGIG